MLLSKKQRWRIVCMRGGTHSARHHHHDDATSLPRVEEHAPAGLVRAVLERLGADIEGGSEGGSDTGGSEEDSRRSSRSVSFDDTARVMLVPTRQELLAIGASNDDADADGDAPREEGLWWTRKDCNKFRRSFRRQIFAQGLQKSCTTMLMGDQMVYKIGRDDEENAEEEEGSDADVGAGAGARAGAGAGGRNGSCSSSCGGAEVSPSPSPILAGVMQDFV
eukprot:g13052.t1